MNENHLNITWMAGDPAKNAGAAEKELSDVFSFYDLNYAPWLPKDRASAILDFGCGAGGLLKYLKLRGFSNLEGFEPDSRYAKFASNHLKTELSHGEDPLLFLKKNESKYDLVICRQVAYYFPRSEISVWFEALAKTLKPNGRLVIEAFNGACFTASWIFQKDPYIQFVFTEPLLHSLIQTTGLKTVFFGGDKMGSQGVKRKFWLTLRWAWAKILKVVYFIERGLDSTNPTIFTKSLIVVAERPS